MSARSRALALALCACFGAAARARAAAGAGAPPNAAALSGGGQVTGAVTQISRRVQAVFQQVYLVKTATDKDAPKASYGSCFVVDAAGLLATNFHVVASALHDPEKYNLYVVDGDVTLLAEVVAFDAAEDLAIIKVDRTFPQAVHFAAAAPETGTKIYSIGWPEDLNKSVIEGNFNGVMAAGPYQKLQMSIPLNPGMSGGPTINEAGEVLGVNVSIRVDSQSLAFAVPRAQLLQLLKRPLRAFSHPPTTAAFDEEVRSQLERVQEQLAQLLLKGVREPVALGGWLAEKPGRMVKCWREQESGAGGLSTSTMEHCYMPGAMPVRHDVETGTFHVKFQTIESARLNAWQYLTQVNETLNGFPMQLAEFTQGFTTPFSCGELDVSNAHKVPVRAHYCLSAYVRYPEIYNFEMEAVTLTQGRTTLLLGASLLGFSSRNGTEIIRSLIDSIRPEPP